MIDIDGQVSTLIKGACRKVKKLDSILYKDIRKNNIDISKEGEYYIVPVICYKSWKKIDGSYI